MPVKICNSSSAINAADFRLIPLDHNTLCIRKAELRFTDDSIFIPQIQMESFFFNLFFFLMLCSLCCPFYISVSLGNKNLFLSEGQRMDYGISPGLYAGLAFKDRDAEKQGKFEK